MTRKMETFGALDICMARVEAMVYVYPDKVDETSSGLIAIVEDREKPHTVQFYLGSGCIVSLRNKDDIDEFLAWRKKRVINA